MTSEHVNYNKTSLDKIQCLLWVL